MSFFEVLPKLRTEDPVVIKVYLCLMAYADKEGVCWPALPRLAADADLSVRTVQRAIKTLIAKGYLTSEQRMNTSNMYQLRNPGVASFPDIITTETLEETIVTEKPKQNSTGALLVAKYWTGKTAQSKAVIATVVSQALENVDVDTMTKALQLLSSNDSYVSEYSLTQACNGKVVNGKGVENKGQLDADKKFDLAGHVAKATASYEYEGSISWEVEL